MQKQYGLTAQGEALPKFRHQTHSSLTKWLPLTPQTIKGKPVNTVSARELHAFLNVGRDFSTWIQDRIAEYGFVEEVDYTVADTLRSPNSGSSKARPQRLKEYALSLNVQQSTIHLAAAKSAAEIGVSILRKEPTHALAWFFVGARPSFLEAALPYLLGSICSVMAVRVRASQGALGSFLTSYANLVRAATIFRLASSGGRENLTRKEAAIMATVPTPVLPTIFTSLSYRRRACRLSALRRIRTTATYEAQACANHADLPTINTLLEQLSETLDQTDLSIQERAQFCALLDALRIEIALSEEDLS
ncbi:antA/AntB antirepressor family protein [Aeromonas enteropelogenes]|uniref:antA/AntB antirepressor family protein n=1 Tax=Aeromonas enteropelogenes TaxID=29489 RepID=UPI0031375499